MLLWAVAVFGLATVVFGVSRSFWLTFACLALTGATDTVSMIIRNIVRQLETPDRLRGRMIGVNMVFFIGGPQLGEFEAGAVANWLGATFSVVSGGIGCLIATAWVAWSTPALRRYREGRPGGGEAHLWGVGPNLFVILGLRLNLGPRFFSGGSFFWGWFCAFGGRRGGVLFKRVVIKGKKRNPPCLSGRDGLFGVKGPAGSTRTARRMPATACRNIAS